MLKAIDATIGPDAILATNTGSAAGSTAGSTAESSSPRQATTAASSRQKESDRILPGVVRLSNRSIDVAIIDVPWNGLAESHKISTMAEAYEINCAPHNFYGHMSTLMSAHLCAAMPNFRIMEIDIDDVPWKDDLVTHSPVIENGELIVPTRPGWGADINEEAVKAGYEFRCFHICKTIDNDLNLPLHGNTFVFQTARHIGTGIVINSSRILGRDPKEMSDRDRREKVLGYTQAFSSFGGLLVGAAIGARGDYLERAAELIRARVDFLVVDMFANYCTGREDLKGSIAQAERQAKRIYR